ncbi:MAG: N-acetylmuramoyl-L-alanine amidase [Chloroflexi bacterium]|nr:N-acetylmuramoyl-L-alanine amidase [Chloroflexota bacterium]
MRWVQTPAIFALLVLVATGCISVRLQGPADQMLGTGQQATKSSETRSAQWRQSSAVDFQDGTHFKTKATAVGDGAVTLDGPDGVREGTFTSTVRQASFPFNAVGAVQSSRVPQGAVVDIEVRTSENGKDWSSWVPVHALTPTQDEKDDAESQIVAVKTGRYLQYRALLTSTGEAPVLEDITITYIDSTQGPDMKEAKNALLPKSAGQPSIISRKGWGANEKYRYDANSKEVWPEEYRKPVKIVIHHTLTPNGEKNPPSAVRAIYYYHAVTLGWGDIGYNYLVDAQGNIYEGRRGDGVVAGHSYGHNAGSIGIAVLGDYTSTAVTDATRKSLTELLTWLTDKYAIDPRGESFFVDHNLPNISGHRDANKTTCPGNYLYKDIPGLRQATFDKLTPSTIKIDSPADGAYVFELTPVKLGQQDKWPLSKVDYFVDDKPIASLKAPNLAWSLDPTKLPEGQHKLKAVVTNSLGKQSAATRDFVVRKPPAISWYFAEGSTTQGYQTWLLLMNPNPTPAKAVVTLFDEGGKTDRRELQVAAKSRLNVFLNEIVPNRAVGIRVDADQAIYAERAMYFGHDGHTTMGTTSLSKTWYFAEGSTEAAFETWLLVMNPSDKRAKISVTYYRPNGSVITKAYDVAPTSRFNVWANKDVPDSAVSIKVDSDIPVVAERSMYFDRGRAGHNTSGAIAPSPTWYFAEGSGGPDFNTWILLLNPNDQQARVTAIFLTERGQPQTVAYNVPPRSRMNVWVNQIVPSGAVAARLQSDRPIVAERSMYWADGRAGHNTLGTTAPASQWFLPEGSATGFNEWILMLNPDAAPANVTLTFYDERGNGTVKSYQVPGNSRFSVWANQVVSGYAISTFVQSDRPIVVERSSYLADNSGGTNSMGIPR